MGTGSVGILTRAFSCFAFGGELELAVGSFVYLTISILDGFLFWKIKLLLLNWNYFDLKSLILGIDKDNYFYLEIIGIGNTKFDDETPLDSFSW